MGLRRGVSHGYGKKATYERFGVAWCNDGGSLYVKLSRSTSRKPTLGKMPLPPVTVRDSENGSRTAAPDDLADASSPVPRQNHSAIGVR
jgi:hypothetical protein